jgi:cell wall-associated NlpC family hydrolase
MDPSYAATQFYKHLAAVPGWTQMTVNDAAQAVERSGFPQAYGPHEQAARQIVAAVTGALCTNDAGSGTSGTGSCAEIEAPNSVALAAITYACKQLGLPYQWGGNGPADGDHGFDCSGLTTAAYAAAGVSLTRTAQTQYDAGPKVRAGQPLLPGDLVFFGTPGHVHHVGLYIGAGKMVHAPTFGQLIKVGPYRWSGDDYLGATRPVN